MRTPRLATALALAAGAGAAAGACALAALAPAAALAAPVVSTPPSVSGSVAFGQTVTCDPGAWSGDPVAFRYDWVVNGSSRGSGRSFAIDDPYLRSYPLACQVTATDAAGATGVASSPPGVPALGRVTVGSVRATAARRGRIVVTGRLGPAVMLRRWGGASVVLRRTAPGRRDGGFFQLSDSVRAKRDGSFRVVGIDAPGRWTIRVDVVPEAIQLYDAPSVTRRVTVSRGGRGCGGCSVLG